MAVRVAARNGNAATVFGEMAVTGAAEIISAAVLGTEIPNGNAIFGKAFPLVFVWGQDSIDPYD